MNRGSLGAVCQRKGIVRIHRFHFDHDECSADAAFLFGLQGDCGGGGLISLLLDLGGGKLSQ